MPLVGALHPLATAGRTKATITQMPRQKMLAVIVSVETITPRSNMKTHTLASSLRSRDLAISSVADLQLVVVTRRTDNNESHTVIEDRLAMQTREI
jgi:predicted short-subunit dehydrogenase-like oxidoreductase (DUF2520 family)